ncbi:MAG: hypothetical protein QQN41_07960, partial [Nitrosopumilus sp.]
MAFGITSFYKMGVAVLIPNYRFIFGSNIVGTLTTDENKTSTVIGVTHSYADLKNMIIAHNYLHTFQDQADKIIIGPSSDVDNLNAIEEWVIESVDINSVTLLAKPGETGLRYKYKDGDPVSITTGQWPIGGWTTNNLDGNTNNKIDVMPLNQFDPVDPTYSFYGNKAWYDDYAFSFSMFSSESFNVNTPELKLSLGNILIPATYRLGIG